MGVEFETALDTNIRRGLLELLILQLLKEDDMTSYELSIELAKRTNGVFKIRQETIYTALHRLDGRKMVSPVHTKRAPDRRLANYYHIEDLGRAYLTYGAKRSRVILSEFLKLIEN